MENTRVMAMKNDKLLGALNENRLHILAPLEPEPSPAFSRQNTMGLVHIPTTLLHALLRRILVVVPTQSFHRF